MITSLTKSFRFEAAHYLPQFPPDHPCRRMHGHSFSLDIIVIGEVDPDQGCLIDYRQIKQHVKPIIDQLDHHLLNEIQGLSNPTAENLCKWIWDQLKPRLPLLDTVIVHETANNACEYRGK